MREKKEKIFITKSARELLFDGYEDELLDLFKELNVTSINIPFKKFGWFVEVSKIIIKSMKSNVPCVSLVYNYINYLFLT